MALNLDIPWHRESWKRFISESLPNLLERHLPLSSYQVIEQDAYQFSLKLAFAFADGEIEIDYDDLPQPDTQGLFCVEGNYRVVVPYPSEVDLEDAQIYCVGEQLEQFFAERLSRPPEGMRWDKENVQLWLPIDAWMREFHGGPTSQYLQISNWLDRYTHMRRLSLIPIMPEPPQAAPGALAGSLQAQVFPPQRKGLVCPYCTPEGHNITRLLHIARGATIKDGQLVRVDDRPINQLGFTACMVPFLEHDDTNRALMGINMMRNWQADSDPNLPLHAAGWQDGYHEKARAHKGNKPEPA